MQPWDKLHYVLLLLLLLMHTQFNQHIPNNVTQIWFAHIGAAHPQQPKDQVP